MRPSMRTRTSSNSKTNGVGVQVEDTRICVVMVGLPARGKSLIAQKGMSRLYLDLSIGETSSLLIDSSCAISCLAEHHRQMLQRR